MLKLKALSKKDIPKVAAIASQCFSGVKELSLANNGLYAIF